MSIEQNIFNLTELNKKYNTYKTNYIALEIELRIFIKKYELTNINMQLNEEPSFISLEVICTTIPSINEFKSYEQEFKEEFGLKLIKVVEINEYYEQKMNNICKYIYINKNNTQFDEIKIDEV